MTPRPAPKRGGSEPRGRSDRPAAGRGAPAGRSAGRAAPAGRGAATGRSSGPASVRPTRGSSGRGNPSSQPRRSSDDLGGEQVEGRQAVLELLRAKRRPVRKIFMAETLDPSPILDQIEELAKSQRVPVQYVSMARLDREARTETHQGIFAEAAKIKPVSLEDLLDVPNPFLLVGDGVTDPRNLGAILRSAEGAGVTGVVLPRHRTARLSPSVTKTAAGAIEYLPFAQVGGIPTAIDQLNKRGVLTVGLAGEGDTHFYDIDFSLQPVALVIGSEESGLAQLTRKRCQYVARLPQLGRISSLNASVAASVAAYEVARQRGAR